MARVTGPFVVVSMVLVACSATNGRPEDEPSVASLPLLEDVERQDAASSEPEGDVVGMGPPPRWYCGELYELVSSEEAIESGRCKVTEADKATGTSDGTIDGSISFTGDLACITNCTCALDNATFAYGGSDGVNTCPRDDAGVNCRTASLSQTDLNHLCLDQAGGEVKLVAKGAPMSTRPIRPDTLADVCVSTYPTRASRDALCTTACRDKEALSSAFSQQVVPFQWRCCCKIFL